MQALEKITYFNRICTVKRAFESSFSLLTKCGKSLKCILSEFEVSMFSRFQNSAVQSYQFSSYFSVAILPVL